jgi:hypothetical protein
VLPLISTLDRGNMSGVVIIICTSISVLTWFASSTLIIVWTVFQTLLSVCCDSVTTLIQPHE